MKTFIVALVVLIALITGISFYSSYLNNTINQIEKDLDNLIKIAKEENWDECSKAVTNLIKKWDKHESILAMFNDHEDVDDVKLALGELKESVRHEDSEHTLKALTEAKTFIERLQKNETLTLENILNLAPFSLSCHNML